MIATIYRYMECYTSSISHYQLASKERPDFILAYLGLATSFKKIDQEKQANDAYETAIKLII